MERNTCPVCFSPMDPHRHWYQGEIVDSDTAHWRCYGGHEIVLCAYDVRNPPLSSAQEKQLRDFMRQQAGETLYTESGNVRKKVKDPRAGRPLRCFDTRHWRKGEGENVVLMSDDMLWCGDCQVVWWYVTDEFWQEWLRRADAEAAAADPAQSRLALPGTPLDPEWLPGHLSFSGMEKFLNCPQAWFRRYVLKEEDPSGWDAVVGVFVHACMELVVPYGRRQTHVEFLRAVARELWESAVHGVGGRIVPVDFEPRLGPDIKRVVFDELQGPGSQVLPTVEMAERVFKLEVWNRLLALFDFWQRNPARFGDPFEIDGRHSLEVDLSCRLGDVDFVGYGDYLGVLADWSVATVDYKSGKQPRYGPAKAVKRHQLQLYMAAVKEKFGWRPSRSLFVYANHDEVQVTTVEPDEAPVGVEKINEVWAEIKTRAAQGAQAFDAKPGPLCSWCPHATTCPVGAKAVMERIANPRLKDGPMAAKLMALDVEERSGLLGAA